MDKLRFGTFLAPNVLPLYQAIADEVGKQIGIKTELVVETSYENCEKDLNEVCFVCSLPYVEYERKGIVSSVPIAAPVLLGKRYNGKPIYFSDVIVKKDSPFKTLVDLRGYTWAYNEPLSWSGYGITRYHLVKLGETHGFFGKVIESGFHEKSIRMVANGEVDASAIDSQVLAIAMRDFPELAEKLRVIDSFGPSTIQPVAVSKRVPEDLRKKIQEVILSLHNNPNVQKQLAGAMVEEFVEVDSNSYNDIRFMLQECEKANFMTIR